MQQKKRLQLDLSEAEMKRLADLEQKIGASTQTAVLRYAVATLEWVTDTSDDSADLLQVVGRDGKVKGHISTRWLTKPF